MRFLATFLECFGSDLAIGFLIKYLKMGSCCSTNSKGMGKRIDAMEPSTVEDDGAASSPPKSSKRWITRKKTRGERVVDRDVGHQVEIPGRLIGNGGSKVACLYTQQGKKGTNQDAMLVWEVSDDLVLSFYSCFGFDCFVALCMISSTILFDFDLGPNSKPISAILTIIYCGV